MRIRKSAWIILFIGVLLTLSCIVLGRSLVMECALENGSNSMQKVLVSLKNEIDTQGANSFSVDDMKRLKKELSENDISYTANSGLTKKTVSNGGTAVSVKLTGVDCMYPLFNNLRLESGSFITSAQEEEGTMVAVIDDELAGDLFKTADATGGTLNIYGKVFRIIGVAQTNDSIIGKLTDDGLPDVYIPAGAMLDLDSTANITSIQIKTANNNTLDRNADKISQALGRIGKNPSDYNIRDYNLKYALMVQEPLLLVFILGIISILALLTRVKNTARRLYALIRNSCRKDSFSNVIRLNLADIGTLLFGLTAGIAGIALLFLGIRFRLYLPPQYVPDELINISYYSNLIRELIQGEIQSLGYISPRPELIANTAGMLLNLLFLLSAVVGLLLLRAGLSGLRAANIDESKLTLAFALLFILSLAVLGQVALLAGLPFTPDAKGIAVAWAFIFIQILLFCDERRLRLSR